MELEGGQNFVIEGRHPIECQWVILGAGTWAHLIHVYMDFTAG